MLADIPAQVERLDYHRTPSAERIFPVIRNLHALWPDGQSPQGQDGPRGADESLSSTFSPTRCAWGARNTLYGLMRASHFEGEYPCGAAP
ncbi:hypothetical protein EBQ24_01780 [Allofranklinella schreckenbergeri]|uniref:Uncharacterized protein n=1 Tax=Allofranklinella schreckenbergeri TaxID=1076744 RepID=A0A3M6R9I3_9BURK|nr:hypothetical protein EBQ24_01780 [Allofranklinella schreckenbergeri]